MTKVLLPVALALLVALPAASQTSPAAPRKPAGPAVPGISGTASEASTAAPGAPARATAKTPERFYDEAADAKAVVASAVAQAKREKKRVLVTLGANWCGWCRALDRTFTRDAKVAAALEKSYVPVKVDVGRMTKNLDLAASWGADPKKDGVPLLVVLDGDGKAVKVQESGSLESGKGHDRAKLLAFLAANAGI